MIRKLQGSTVFQETHNELIHQAFQEGLIDATVVAMDATHIEARDRRPEKQTTDNSDELPTELPKKKRGRKSKAEREQWLQEQMELEANRLFSRRKSKNSFHTRLLN